MDIAIVQRDCATVDEDSTSSILPNNESTSVKASTPSGRWGGFMCRKQSTYILRAHTGAIQSMSAKASTPSGRWGGFMKANAHSCLVVVDVAVVQRDCA